VTRRLHLTLLLLSITVLHLRQARADRAVLLQQHRDRHALDGLELAWRVGR
jgi:hypothetical protein